MHFVALFFVLSKMIHEVNYLHQIIFKLILKVVPVLFLAAVFSFFSCESVNFAFTFTSLYSTIYTNYRTFVFPLGNSRIVSFDFSRTK